MFDNTKLKEEKKQKPDLDEKMILKKKNQSIREYS
jgi:hypothetical protein